ncbi:hypothetical protein YB2330_000201 [Saitoella coloradoensis]
MNEDVVFATSSMIQSNDRIIIQLDLDFFYGQVEQLANPSLRALPFGIQQKQIIVTCNYLARERGVGKLQLLTDAVRACPELVIVNGEDLNRFRKASRDIFGFVRNLVGDECAVQRLGMDELWIDVTSLVEREARDRSASWIPGEDHRGWAGHMIDLNGDRLYTPEATTDITQFTDGETLYLASYLARYMRDQLHEQLGFTCSAGIATSKLLSKLAATEHKPADQTLVMPEAYGHFLRGVQVKKLNGFGYKTLKVLYEKLGSWAPQKDEAVESDMVDEDDSESYFENYKPQDKAKTALLDVYKDTQLTVGFVIENSSLAEFRDWFGGEQGQCLWSLLHGVDATPVKASPLYPSTISIEDSFLHCSRIVDASRRLLELTVDLLDRLEMELYDQATDRWAKYPRTLRLTIRLRSPNRVKGEEWRDKREGRGTGLPVEVFEVTRMTKQERASRLLNGTVIGLFKKMVGEKEWDCSLFNIAVVNFEDKRPTASIGSYFASGAKGDIDSAKMMVRPAEVDDEVWNTLPEEMKREVLVEYKRDQQGFFDRANGSTTKRKAEEGGKLGPQLSKKRGGIAGFFNVPIPTSIAGRLIAQASPTRPLEVDEEVWASLPADLKAEIAVDYGAKKSAKPAMDVNSEGVDAVALPVGHARERVDEPSNGFDKSVDSDSDRESFRNDSDDDAFTCPSCGFILPMFVRAAHLAYHEEIT